MAERESPERPGGALTGVSILLEGKGLFDPATPQGENPTWYPIQVMSQLQSDLAMRAYRNRQDTARAEKLTAWKESLHKVEMAYEIIAYPRLIGSGYDMAVAEGIADAIAHPNQETKEHPHRAPIELNTEEVSVLGKLTQARGLPFDPDKRVYRYAELAALREAEHYLTDIEWKARGGQVNPGGKTRDEIDKEIRKRQEKWRGEGTDEPPEPEPPKPEK
jgi:hypothetical protein